VYLCAGVFAWNLFAEVVQRGHTVFIEHGQLIRKMSFPRLCLPVVVVLNALVNFAAVFVVLLGFLLVVGAWPGWPLLGLVVPLALMATIGIALGVTLGVLNVFFRDVGPAVGIGLQFWFWLTPIVYPLQALPTGLAAGLQVNPLLPLVAACQRVLVEGRWPDWSSLWAPALLAVLLCALAWRVFRRHAADMADEL
jgi:lipopolysaccharide transport system permease protein